jgi:hypothetical protein
LKINLQNSFVKKSMDTIPTIAEIRQVSHQLSRTDYTTPSQIVAHFGMMQAQDFNSVCRAIGARLGGCTEKSIQEAFNKGEILRTHVLRPTWHFVTPENIRWMLQLSAKQIMQSMKSRDRDLGITDEFYVNCYRIIEKALEKENDLTREELTKALHDAGMKPDTPQMNHALTGAEANGIICSGVMREKTQTYALLEKRVPPAKPLTEEESLAKLTRIYFTGHAPASLPDFVWWSGLTVGEARRGLQAVQREFISETVNGQMYWMPDIHFQPPENELHLLPAFDEYIVGYRDRTAVITSENHVKAISSNGVFRPVIIKDGKVIGLWKKAASGKKKITVAPFEPVDDATQQLIEKAAENFQIYNS